eukprot:1142759-Pelagomonas_calceolata.AAC.4
MDEDFMIQLEGFYEDKAGLLLACCTLLWRHGRDKAGLLAMLRSFAILLPGRTALQHPSVAALSSVVNMLCT